MTHEQKTDYTLMIHSLDANYENSMLVKLGETYRLRLPTEGRMMLKFIIDEKANF